MNEVQLIITFKPGQGVEVSGPIGDKIFCYGILEAAKDAIRDFAAKPASPLTVAKIVPHINGGN